MKITKIKNRIDIITDNGKCIVLQTMPNGKTNIGFAGEGECFRKDWELDNLMRILGHESKEDKKTSK